MPDPAAPAPHSHPGGTGAVLGTYLARFSGVQGVSLLVTNFLSYVSIPVVARFLGADALGSFALLFFGTAMVTQVIHLASKPGTIMRTFGVADEDDDVEDDEQADEGISTRPTYTLGVGIVWCTFLAAVAIGLAFVFRTQIAEFLLNDPGQGDAVLFATITGALWALFKLGETVYWFERRPLAYALIDASRPAFNLIAIVAILASGAGVTGAVVGQAIGTTLATVLCIALLRGSYQLGFSFGELWEILKRGSIRVPIASSMWVIQNADIFLLSRFVSHEQIGLYTLASRTGFMVAILPQGFRMALRPIRKSAVFTAYRQEYGVPVAQGQLLAYFVLITLTAVLAMVLAGEILIQIGGPKFESVAAIVPLTAAAMSMPALYRTISATSVIRNKRRIFVIATIFAALIFVGLMLLLLSQTEIGIYAAPISMLLAFIIPSTFIFLRSQLGDRPIRFPYLAILQATLVASGLAVAYHFAHPEIEWLQLPLIALVMAIWIASLFALRIIPRYHWHPIGHIARRRSGDRLCASTRERASARWSLVSARRCGRRSSIACRRKPWSPRLPLRGRGSRRKGLSGRAATPTDPRRAPGWCACCAARASAAASRSSNPASSMPGSRCSCSRSSRSRSGWRRCGRCSRPAPAPTTSKRWRICGTASPGRRPTPGARGPTVTGRERGATLTAKRA